MSVVLVPVLLVTAYLLGLGVGSAAGVASGDLVLVVVVGVSLARGSVTGASTGFVAGLLLDLAPGSSYPVGSGALSGALAGGLVGLVSELGERRTPLHAWGSPIGRGALAAAVTAAALVTQSLVRHGIGVVLGAEPGMPGATVLVPAAGTVLVAALVVPVLTSLATGRNLG